MPQLGLANAPNLSLHRRTGEYNAVTEDRELGGTVERSRTPGRFWRGEVHAVAFRMVTTNTELARHGCDPCGGE